MDPSPSSRPILFAPLVPWIQPPCPPPAHRQFDFWIGDWDVYEIAEPQTTPVARVRVELRLDGCVLHEVYEGVNGLEGESLSLWDPALQRWHQSWVTNRGQLLQIDGGM